MNQHWQHEQLGTFERISFGWKGRCDLPVFSLFNWEVSSDESTRTFDLVFESETGEEPSLASVALASNVIASQAKLPMLITTALWEDFNGRGHNSRMWWHGDLDSVAEHFTSRHRSHPFGPVDLLPAMRFGGIAIHQGIDGYLGPLAKFVFSALFEEEHGVGILFDGSKVVGTGYMCDVSPFESK